ncbi:transglutaminase domain protein [Methylocella silvestris BL2]|uniref:Transglutaminase domain protein n=1 Tax=Methylocella silvestris (strain DSM 15510 / CIP 108128 / LMG 27833 / NCIMB 13906 / BL2) TaxID=395965 RepID=B8ESN8_METSB|nr:transglutaminase family protein [Methylocella silvestris]ACK50373.1 transglutaminase domain protein [Methylocella silvestris BL2]
MARINIVHTTEYSYRNPVGLTRHRLMLRPRDSHDLRLNSVTLAVHPTPAKMRYAHDVFDNSICYLEWAEPLRTKELSIVSTLDLTHYPIGAALPVYSLDPAAELFPFSYASEEVPDLGRLTERQQPDPNRTVDAFARRFVSGPGETRTLQLLEDMTHAIKAELTYGARHEEGTQTAAQTLELGTGTCRDFAMLMIEAIRSLGLAARFVSGYLYDDLTGTQRGGGSTHAWVSVYLPGAGWVEYDPTNGLIAGANLVRVCETRTPQQALPVAGGYFGEAADFLAMNVCVSVSAAPVPVAAQRAG